MPSFLRLASGVALVAAAMTVFGPVARSTDVLPLRTPSPTGAFLAGEQALKDMHTDRAASLFMSAATADWENPVLVQRAFLALAADGQIENAAGLADHLLEFEPSNELARLVIATEQLKRGDYAGTLTSLDAIGEASFSAITSAILKAWAMVGEGRYDDAGAVLDKVAGGRLRAFEVFHRALMAEVAGRTEDAMAFSAEAYKGDPLVARVVEAYARIHAEAGAVVDAKAAIDNFTDSGYFDALLASVSASIAAGEEPGPFAPSIAAGASELFYSIGVALARDGSTDFALVFLQLGRFLDPEADIISVAYGQVLESAGQNDAAIAVYDAIPASSPLKPSAVVRIAQNLDSKGEREEAIRRLGNIVATTPDDLDAQSVLGDMLRYDKQFAAAAEAYTKAIDIEAGDVASDWRLYYVRGIAYERNNQWPLAEADFRRALELNPDQPQVLNYLGYTWIDRDMHLDEALEMIEKAVAAAPNDGYIVDSLGWAFYKLGRMDEAVEVLEQAVQMMPSDPELNDHLGDAYWRVGRKLEARFQWTIAASVDEEDGDVRKRVQAKLTGGLPELPSAVETSASAQ